MLKIQSVNKLSKNYFPADFVTFLKFNNLKVKKLNSRKFEKVLTAFKEQCKR